MLGPHFEIVDMTALPGLAPAVESGQTFEENARIKARHAAAHFHGLVLADDSGLEVDALGGAPGVRSARYAGENATDAENRAKLLREMRRAGGSRAARFTCVLVLMAAGRAAHVVNGVLDGEILTRQKGAGGFGYDALFQPSGCQESLAQMTPLFKNRLSHRGRAMEKLRSLIV